LSRWEDRPVKVELVELFKQNNLLHVTVADTVRLLRATGHPHVDAAVRDNLFLLFNSGFLTYDDSRRFSLNNGAKDLSKKIELPYTPKQPKIDHCDKCHRKFKRGQVPLIRKFANFQLYLCKECYTPKIVA
jgi:hypothetical protein